MFICFWEKEATLFCSSESIFCCLKIFINCDILMKELQILRDFFFLVQILQEAVRKTVDHAK